MSRIFLKTTCVATNQSTFLRTVFEWDTATRTQVSSTSNELACQVFELQPGTLVDRWCELNGTRVSIYFKAGTTYDPFATGPALTGRTEEATHADCPLPTSFTLAAFPVITPTSTAFEADGAVTISYVTPNPPVAAVLAGVTSVNTTASGVLVFEGIPAGTYTLEAYDAAQSRVLRSGIVVATVGDMAVAPNWIRWAERDEAEPNTNDPANPNLVRYREGTAWDATLKRVYIDAQSAGVPLGPVGTYARPLDQLVDSYYMPGGAVFRRVFHRDDTGDGIGDGNVRFVDTLTPSLLDVSVLQLDNIILQHVHLPATAAAGLSATGRVLLEASSPAPGPLTYTRLATGQANTTGRFADLAPGPHRFRAQDSGGNSIETTITIEDRYRVRWFLDSCTPTGVTVRVDILGRDYQGTATEVIGAGRDCLERSWETAGQDVEGVLPEAQGQGSKISLYQQAAGQFADVFLSDDRAFRKDVRVNGVLVFRGYLLPDLYDEDLSTASGGVITFTAGDGLGGLRGTSFLNHLARPLAKRWPLVQTVLHCLSRCECGPLPLYVQADLQEATQPANTDWLATFYSDRAGYADPVTDGRSWTCRQVLEAVLRAAHAVLVQRNGAWWIVSANAAGTAATFFAYAPDGEPLTVPAALATPLQLRAPNASGGNLNWVDATQRAQTLAVLRAVVASTRLLLVKNQLADGLLQTWQADLRRPLGWGGSLEVERMAVRAPEDVKPVAGRTKLRIGITQMGDDGGPDGPFLLSPALAFKPGVNETPVRVAIRLRVRSTTPGFPQTTQIRVRPEINGEPYPTLLTWVVGSEEKEVTVEGFIPFGEGTGVGLLRLRLLPPPGPVGQPLIDVYEVIMQTLPGAVEWPDADEVTALSESGFLVLPPVETHHADAPQLPLSDGTTRPVPMMDAPAWRHILTYADGRPTAAWRRSTSLLAAPLLETVAQDRLDLRRAPVSVFAGPVRGVALHGLGFGSVVDAPDDAPGVRFWCVGARVIDLDGRGELTLREIGLTATAHAPVNKRIIAHTMEGLITHDGAALVWA